MNTINFFREDSVMNELEQKPSVEFVALVLINIAYKKGFINKETFQAIQKKYGGDHNAVHE